MVNIQSSKLLFHITGQIPVIHQFLKPLFCQKLSLQDDLLQPVHISAAFLLQLCRLVVSNDRRQCRHQHKRMLQMITAVCFIHLQRANGFFPENANTVYQLLQ